METLIGKIVIINFKGTEVLLCPTPLSLVQTNIPSFVNSSAAPAHWYTKVLKHEKITGLLSLEVTSYHRGSAEIPRSQKAFNDQLSAIKQIEFRSINTEKLLSTFSLTPKIPGAPSEEHSIPDLPTTRSQITRTMQIPIKKLKFHLGRVSFFHRFKGYAAATEISIENHEVRAEFDAIKNYFEKVFGKKKIDVHVMLEINGSYASIISATSPEISSIDKDLIDSVRFEFVKGLKRKVAPPEIDKSLFTADEFLDQFSGDAFKSNTFHSNASDLFEDLLQISDSKHYKQLRYLSSIHASHIMKLRFVHDPFSFIFLVEGENNYHIIWETLDTKEATYIWHTAKNLAALKSGLNKVEHILHVIKVQGKTAYINATEDHFRRIYHDYSEVVEGFIKWKGMLERYLS